MIADSADPRVDRAHDPRVSVYIHKFNYSTT